MKALVKDKAFLAILVFTLGVVAYALAPVVMPSR